MKPEDWARVRAAFDRVAEHPASERQAALEAACGADPVLRGEIEAMLAAEAAAGAFLDAPLPPPEAVYTPSAGYAAILPERIGPYRVVRIVGRGGMGVVYEAQQPQSGRRVALKVLRAGLDSSLLRRRFRREREILGALAHPGIARFHDGGKSEDGRPYLAMEYVEGTTLLEHADLRRLSVSDRLRLFLPVCDAVEYAHARQVVHRDLKPSNILVTAEGAPKLLDFGVAKLLDTTTGEGESTLTAAPLMTPEYASPEQIRGEAVGARSDVYSLGVVLYELLTGRRPYRLGQRTAREVERAVCETDPERPSTAVGRVEEFRRGGETVSVLPVEVSSSREGTPERLRRRLRGDLDAVLLKALRKDPGARYGSVGELADDLRRHLEGRPVAARRGSWRYRAAKTLQRHRLVAAALLLAAAALGAGWVLARVSG